MGFRLAESAGVGNTEVLGFIHHHHEKWKGGGYPQGLEGVEIPLPARIGAVADVFDALTTKRPYKEAFHNAKALQIILKDADLHFDKKIVRTFLSSVGLFPPGTIVEMSDSSIGLVLLSHDGDLLRPKILRYLSPKGVGLEKPTVVDLEESQGLFIPVAVKPRRSGRGYKATTSAGFQCTSESSPTVLRRNWRQNSLGTRGRFARSFPGFPENPSGAIYWRPL